MLRVSNKSLFHARNIALANSVLGVSAVRALPPSFRTYLHVAAGFHTSRPNLGWPILFVGALKSTVVLNCLQMITRIALTLVPMAILRKHIGYKWIKKLDRHPNKFPEFEKMRPKFLQRIRTSSIIIRFLLLGPLSLFGLVIFASLERTPITGRMRLMVISPDEEETIARDLSGPGWFEAVRDILATQRESPQFIPSTDWRYKWAERTLRRLESIVPALQDEKLMRQAWLARDINDPPFPPPLDYPLLPRPRASQRIHYLEPPDFESEHDHKHAAMGLPPHSVLGPPYSLLITNEPNQSNAFSYGFGPGGSGGVVIFSGFLDEILRSTPSKEQPTSSSSSQSFTYLRSLFIPQQNHTAPIPTPEQDLQLAILMAHELAHLLLSHHLETLSSATFFVPTLLSLVTDVFRTLLFPITMVGGPFLNDALEQVGEVGKREFGTIADSCSSHHMELEADVVSIRLLALAGWDPRAAVRFWESKVSVPLTEEMRKQAVQTQLPGVLPGALWVSQDGGVHSSSHPVDAVRVEKMREELERWHTEKRRYLAKMAASEPNS
ncbi:hypothetical protein BU17DRAFT_78408 [Hysterangium stoloniferum]|nr:hypothetical protein BU17DRAFT_78408 [Hysterangium stoloniferum]